MIMSSDLKSVSDIASSGFLSSENELSKIYGPFLDFPSKFDAWFLRGGCIEVSMSKLLWLFAYPFTSHMVLFLPF